MRSEDLDELNKPYPSVGRPERRLAEALGVGTPSVSNLHEAIEADLDSTIYGIGWWAPHPGTSRRIFISDHLIQCVGSIPRNLAEARLHLLEASDCWERESNFLADAASIGRDHRLKIKLPRRVKPADDLPHALASLHVAGFFRAILAALDCLGASIVGVLALPVRILKADLTAARNSLAKIKPGPSPGAELQIAYATSLSALVSETGPTGWLEWTMAFRHMLVHRARRLEITQLRPQPTIFGPDGRPVMRVESIQHLSRDPQLSDIEALLRRDRKQLVHTEQAERTLKGVLLSTVKLVDGAARHLSNAWQQRRADPALLVQPKDQWPEVPSSPLSDFPGYAPGSIDVDPITIISGPDAKQRILAAALDDAQRDQWKSFD